MVNKTRANAIEKNNFFDKNKIRIPLDLLKVIAIINTLRYCFTKRYQQSYDPLRFHCSSDTYIEEGDRWKELTCQRGKYRFH